MTKHTKKAAPYARNIVNHSNQNELIVCTGKDGWNRAKSPTWFSRTPKTVLPYQENPERYKWPAQNRAVMVFDFNPDPEGFDRLLLLSKQLLIDGAAWVLLMSESFPMVKIQGKGT
jgi:hypothetical protein